MRSCCTGIALVVALAACGGGHGEQDRSDADSGTDLPDATLPTDPVELQPPIHGFQIKTPTLYIRPGTEITYCYYFQTANTGALAIQKWVSRMTPGSHHMIVYLTPSNLRTPGTITNITEDKRCGLASGGSGPIWTYAARTENHEVALPGDDGAGKPVAQILQAGQSGFIQVHYVNNGTTVLSPHIELNGHAYDDGVDVTPAAPYVTYNTQIVLDPGTPAMPTSGMAGDSCAVDADAKFFALTTHAHKQSVHTFIQDGAMRLFDSTTWENPGAATWSAPFYSFASGEMTYQCEYRNPNPRTIEDGDSAELDEACMAIGFYFPAATSAGHLCIDDYLLY